MLLDTLSYKEEAILIKVVQVIQRMDNGRTCPFLVSCSDAIDYIIKFNSNCTRTCKHEFNELIAYRLAKLLDLTIPKSQIVYLSKNMINQNAELKKIGAVAGPCFASEYHKIGSTMITPVLLKKAINLSEIPSMFLFDEIILNDDRWSNMGNLFFDLKTNKIMLIDHSDIFKNGQIWTDYELKSYQKIPPTTVSLDGKLYNLMKDYVRGNKPFDSIKKKIKNVTPQQINNIFTNIPPSWNITKNEIIESKNFVSFQLKHYSEILEKLHCYFPKWKEGKK